MCQNLDTAYDSFLNVLPKGKSLASKLSVRTSRVAAITAVAPRGSVLLCLTMLTVGIVVYVPLIAAQQLGTTGASLFAPSVQVGRELDLNRALPVTNFYAPSTSARSAPPGTLVRAEPANDYDLPPGVSAVRILYHTRTASNDDALASGVVLVPYGQPPKGGWPVLAWAHGTSGVAKQCEPSLMKSVFYNWEGLYEYVLSGYAVVATDYVGLGTEARHAYLDMLSNATDVVNSVLRRASRYPHWERSGWRLDTRKADWQVWVLQSWSSKLRIRTSSAPLS